MLVKKTASFIKKEQLFTLNDRLLVGLSGGADSVALLRVLLTLGYQCEAAHCNFGLRGIESDRDEAFVRSLAKKLGVKLYVTRFSTAEIAKKRHISIEMAARELRYEWFEQLRQETGTSYICVAHHADDNVETILLNLIRGTGLQGLRGIRPCNGQVVRPLLHISKKEILDYLQQLNQDFITDSSNLSTDFVRNKIRLELIPFLETINPSIRKSIETTAHHLNEAYKIYQHGIEEGKRRVYNDNLIHIDSLKKEPSAESLLHEILAPAGFNSTQISDMMNVLDSQSGKTFKSPTHTVIKDRKHFVIALSQSSEKPRLITEELMYDDNFCIPTDKQTACFDADKLTAPLSVRQIKAGDWFIPFGMKGKKKLSDYMTDRKFSLLQKQNQWVLCAGEDIVWLIGERTDNRFRITHHTKRILLVRIC